MQTSYKKLEDGTIEITVTLPWVDVKLTREKVLEAIVQGAELPGFRKGKAPRKLVEERIDKDKIRDEILNDLLPKAVGEAIKEHNVTPIVSPQIGIIYAGEDEDLPAGRQGWQFVVRTAEAPEIDLGDYKQAIQGVTAKSKIVIPGQEAAPVKFDDIVKVLLENVKVKMPGLLLEHEVNHLLSQMLDEIKRLGLTLDQYLSSTNKTIEGIKAEYAAKATADLTIELALQKIAESEKITVEEKEVDEAILKAKDEKERENLTKNKYLLARILRQQKTIDFLTKI